MEIWRKRVKNAHTRAVYNIIHKNQMSQELETGMVINIHNGEQKASVKITGELL